MATMATSHSLSVLTNSSVKPPLDPSTGLSHTMHERKSPSLGRFTGTFYDDYDEENFRSDIYDTRSKPLASTADQASILQLSKLSNEDFYQKLLELKNEQRKTLQRCEQMYREKHTGATQPTHFSNEDEPKVSSSYRETLKSQTFIDDDGILVASRRSPSPEDYERGPSPSSPAELPRKPASGRPPLPYSAKSLTSPLPRPSSAPLARHHYSWSTEDLRKTALGLRSSFEDSDDEYIPDDTVSEPYHPRAKTVHQMEDMWNNFSIEDYAPRRNQTERVSSAAVTKKEKQKKNDGWRHRLTVPEPFSMTLREQSKERKKSKNMLEFEEKMMNREAEEEEECQKKFKARPVPAQVYLPMFDEIQEQKEARRRQVKEMSVELLKSQEKPFSFMKRENDRKKHLTMSKECHSKAENHELKANGFKASPVPKHIFDNSVDEKLLEEEEYRKIRMKMRAEELMRVASLPPNMAAREQLKVQKERENKIKSKRKGHKSASTSRPKVNSEVPDYDALYRQFQQELHRRKMQKESTVAKPFHVESRPTKSAIEKVKQDIDRDEQTLRENRWPYKLPRTKPRNLGHMSMSLDSLPSKSTRSADARSSRVRNHQKELTRQEMHEIEEERRRRVKNMRLREQIQEKTVSRETPRETLYERKKKNRDAERARVEEYERELQEIKDRVNRRPLLFEQESEINAKKKAEKKFNATLRSVGLDEDFVHSRGSRSVSVHEETDQYDDDFDDTADRYEDRTYDKHQQESDQSMSPMED